MTVSIRKTKWSDQELLGLPDDSNKYEVLDGELIVSPAGSLTHGTTIMRIMSPLYNFVLEHNLGQVLEGQSGFRMLNADLLAPDISFISRERWESGTKKAAVFFPGAPDLLVEVLSPSDRPGRTKKRLTTFFENGTRLAWVLDPITRTTQVYDAPEPDKILSIEDVLDGEDVLPEFTLPLRGVFT